MKGVALVIAPEPFTGEDGRRLITDLEEDLGVRYADIDVLADVDLAEMNRLRDDALFLVARVDGEAVGCGALRPHDDGVGEVKRMYVAPSARGTGVGRALLDELRAAAVGLGYRRLVLETGIRQPEAMALYESVGWRPIANYGAYSAAEWSRCYELSLVSPPG